jgi:ATP-dependent Clp protease adapter protein ClpS
MAFALRGISQLSSTRKLVPNLRRGLLGVNLRNVFISPKENVEIRCPPLSAVAEVYLLERPTLIPKLNFVPIYRVILHDPSDYPKQDSIDRLKKAIPNLDIKSVSQIVIMALRHGQAIVMTCMLEEAEKYSERMHMFGLKSSVEPA